MSEFTWINKQGVSSNLGFEVQTVDRFCIEYREGSKVISVEVEAGMSGGKFCLLFTPGSFGNWDNAQPAASLTTDDQSRIEDNIRRALDFQGVKLLADPPE